MYAVRPARLADADRLGRVHVQVWREAYRGHMPDAYLDGLDPAERTALWRTRLELDDPDVRLVVAESPAGELVGFAAAGPPQQPEVAPWQLYAINVLADHHGTGVADELIAAAVGDRAAYLWVLPENERARAFYARHGFAPDGGSQHDEELGVDEVRLVRPSAGPPRPVEATPG
ncbi:MAG TPA: GNAT family N-acetyltransferase [Dermatophilaceae bacterium]|nr:GNAT family N-acetyltransferase [Dermatophilaceae bacterium]